MQAVPPPFLLRHTCVLRANRFCLFRCCCLSCSDPTTVTALNSLVRHLRAESAGLRKSLRERDAEVEQLKKTMALSEAGGTRETRTD